MARLRQTDREAILYTLIERGMKKSNTALATLKQHTAMAGYAALYDAATIERMESLPDGWLPTASNVQIVFDTIRNSGIAARLPKTLRFRDNDIDRWRSPNVSVSKDAYDALDAAITANVKKESALREKVTGVLSSVSTWKKLYEVWPAARNVLLKLEPMSADNLPAIIPQDLNDELDLP